MYWKWYLDSNRQSSIRLGATSGPNYIQLHYPIVHHNTVGTTNSTQCQLAASQGQPTLKMLCLHQLQLHQMRRQHLQRRQTTWKLVVLYQWLCHLLLFVPILANSYWRMMHMPMMTQITNNFENDRNRHSQYPRPWALVKMLAKVFQHAYKIDVNADAWDEVLNLRSSKEHCN